MIKRIVLVLVLLLVAVPAFADYGYYYNKKGTGYYRDRSNDGIQENNANYLGLNNTYGVKKAARWGQQGYID